MTRFSTVMRFAAFALLAPLLVGAGGRTFRHEAMKVRGFEAPVGWEPQPTGAYPRLLAAWETRDGGRMTLVAAKLQKPLGARGLAEESKPALERQGMRGIALSEERPSGDDSERVRLDATLDDGRKFVRQLYAVAGDLGYVLSMTGPLGRAPQMKRDFDEAASSLSVGD